MNLSTSRGWAPSRDAVITTSTPETNVVFAGVVRGRERHAAYGELRLAGTDLRYGVAAEHYASVGAALIWTLEQGLGDDFTPETRDAWIAAYTLLSGVMIDEADPKAA